jgi:hypothetical protein
MNDLDGKSEIHSQEPTTESIPSSGSGAEASILPFQKKTKPRIHQICITRTLRDDFKVFAQDDNDVVKVVYSKSLFDALRRILDHHELEPCNDGPRP